MKVFLIKLGFFLFLTTFMVKKGIAADQGMGTLKVYPSSKRQNYRQGEAIEKGQRAQGQ